MLTSVIALNNKPRGAVTDIPCQVSALFISNFILGPVRNFTLRHRDFRRTIRQKLISLRSSVFRST